jgi:peptidoglycan/xylan/chitin deacetylase (PgdA/CDA1 family)
MGFVVLLYHRVHPEFGLSPEMFRKQMEFLKNHFNLIKLENLQNSKKFPSAMVTFDDGFSDFLFYAFPILKELSIPAVLFVSPDRTLDTKEIRTSADDSNVSTYDAFKNSFLKGDNSPFLSWGELRYLESTGLVSVESHGLTHRAVLGKGKPYKEGKDWRIFSLPEDERKRVKEGTELTSILVSEKRESEEELRLSKEILEEKLGKKIKALAWPWGIYSERAVKVARSLGYEFCFTTERGFNRGNHCRIKRLAVGNKKGMFWFRTRSLLYSL